MKILYHELTGYATYLFVIITVTYDMSSNDTKSSG
jgi:hypothetical protein